MSRPEYKKRTMAPTAPRPRDTPSLVSRPPITLHDAETESPSTTASVVSETTPLLSSASSATLRDGAGDMYAGNGPRHHGRGVVDRGEDGDGDGDGDEGDGGMKVVKIGRWRAVCVILSMWAQLFLQGKFYF